MDNQVKAFVGELEVIGNGTVHVNSERVLNLVIGDNLEVEFNFINDKSQKEFKTSSRADGNKLIFDLVNYVNPLGSGFLNPIELGNLKERKLFISFFVWTPDKATERRIVNYTVYLQKEE